MGTFRADSGPVRDCRGAFGQCHLSAAVLLSRWSPPFGALLEVVVEAAAWSSCGKSLLVVGEHWMCMNTCIRIVYILYIYTICMILYNRCMYIYIMIYNMYIICLSYIYKYICIRMYVM